MCVSKMSIFLSEYGGYSSNCKFMGSNRNISIALLKSDTFCSREYLLMLIHQLSRKINLLGL